MLLTALPMLAALQSSYWLNIITVTYLMAGLAAAWNIIGGFGGQFSLAHGVFFGIGAYLTAGCYVRWGISPWLMLLPSAVLAAASATLLSWPTFRLRGPFFAITTMALNEVMLVLANYFDQITGGPRGILIPFRAGFRNMIFIERWKSAVLMFAFVALVTFVTIALRRSRLGYYLVAVREDEDAARAAGINVLEVKLKGMAVSAAFTACGGGLYAMYLRFIDPPSLFSLLEVGLQFPLLTLIGGIGTFAGPLLGAALIVPASNFIRAMMSGVFPGAHLIALGCVMILAALFMKRGIVGLLTDLARRIRTGEQRR
jgi:branched-chain amino acid transport system permease protein